MRVNRRDALKIFGAAAVAASLLGNVKTGTSPRVPSKKEKQLTYKLGKLPAEPHKVKLRLADYLHKPSLPTPADPDNFGHEFLVKDWGVLGNDTWGDCAIAGPMHALMLWHAEAKTSVNIDTASTLAAYSAITGFDPDAGPSGANPTDNGSNVLDVAEYWRTQGLKDATGKAHKIVTYLALDPGNYGQLMQALYLFDGVGIGIEFPAEYQQAFANGQIWDTLPSPQIVGGHYILGVGARGGNPNVITWGKTQLLTPGAYEQFSDEAFVYFSAEKLLDGKDVNGFDTEQLLHDLADLADEVDEEPDMAPVSTPLTAEQFFGCDDWENEGGR